MRDQPNRLAAAQSHKLAGSEIDRSTPLSFRLDGHTIDGFAGDTVLSALLAAGIDTVGMRAGEPIGLGPRFAPAVVLAGSADAAGALPMAQMPALADVDLVTLGPRNHGPGGPLARLRQLLLRPGRTLGLRLDVPGALQMPWRDLPPPLAMETDLVVVGGGVAGMSAAAAAAAAGEMVILVEREPVLGGDARFFGAVEDEEPPDAAVPRLAAQLAQMDGVTVLTRAEAWSLAGTTVRAHQVELANGRAAGRALVIQAKRVVLATGALERLPVFPGNRLPGIGGAMAAFHLADRYSVWPGKRTLLNTPHNFGYRLALLASDAGMQMERITDTRVDPQSRFVDFCKASGIAMTSGLVPKGAVRAKSGGLSVRFAVAIEGVNQDSAAMQADRFIAAGGWQPELSLWLMAGGQSGWNKRAAWLEARGRVDGVVLAGSAAGYRNCSACIESGRSAVAALLGRPAAPIDDRQIEAIYESPDGPTPVVPGGGPVKAHSYLDSGFDMVERPAPRRKGPAVVFTAQPRALGLEDIAAAVQVGDLPANEAGIVAAERCLGPGTIADGGRRLPPAPAGTRAIPTPPAYLAGRFGPKPQLAIVGVLDTRHFEPGCLIFLNSDHTDPLKAVGVIVGPAPGRRSGGLALIGPGTEGVGATVYVRESGGPVSAELLERFTAERPAG